MDHPEKCSCLMIYDVTELQSSMLFSSSTVPENDKIALFVYIFPPEILTGARGCNELTQ